jgi:hypothetical protein
MFSLNDYETSELITNDQCFVNIDNKTRKAVSGPV